LQSYSKVSIRYAPVEQEIKLLDEGWTAAHGHFLIMGGFSLVRADHHETVLDYESFFDLLGIPPGYHRFEEPFEIAFPAITLAEINDKARGDFLSKAIAILQSTWFIAQCIARGKQGLALTELELITLAIASVNGLVYYFWWDKPLGVKEPIKVYPSSMDPPKKVVKGAGRVVSYRHLGHGICETFTSRCRIVSRRLWRDLRSSASCRAFSVPSNESILRFLNSSGTFIRDSLRAVLQLPLFIIDYPP
jgi:hypothetical protein